MGGVQDLQRCEGHYSQGSEFRELQGLVGGGGGSLGKAK